MVLSKKNIATYFGLISFVMWACGAVFVAKIKHLPIFEILAIVLSFSFIIALIKLTVTGEWYKLKQPYYIWIIGCVGIYGNDALYILAFKHAPVAHADLINYLWPIFLICTTSFLPKERLRIRQVIAAGIAFFGVMLLITEGNGLCGFDLKYLPGYLFALLDALVWAAYSFAARYFGKTPVEMVGMYCGMGAMMSVMSHLQFETFVVPSLMDGIILGVMGITTQGLAYFFWDYSMKRGHFNVLTLLSYFIPVASVALLVVFGLAENSIYLAIGTLCVVIGALFGSDYLPNTKGVKYLLLSARSKLFPI